MTKPRKPGKVGQACACSACLPACLPVWLSAGLSVAEPKSWHVCWSQSLLCFHWLPMLPFLFCTYLWPCRPKFSLSMRQACWLLSLPACMPFLSLHCACACLTSLSNTVYLCVSHPWLALCKLDVSSLAMQRY